MSLRVATARLGRVLHLAAEALLPVEGGEVGDGRGVLGVGRWAHIRGCGALGVWCSKQTVSAKRVRVVSRWRMCAWVEAVKGGVWVGMDECSKTKTAASCAC
jgi:hypothetical protein